MLILFPRKWLNKSMINGKVKKIEMIEKDTRSKPVNAIELEGAQLRTDENPLLRKIKQIKSALHLSPRSSSCAAGGTP